VPFSVSTSDVIAADLNCEVSYIIMASLSTIVIDILDYATRTGSTLVHFWFISDDGI